MPGEILPTKELLTFLRAHDIGALATSSDRNIAHATTTYLDTVD